MPTRRSLDLPLIMLVTVIATLVVLADIDQPLIRGLLTAPLTFLFPGYAVIAAVFTRQSLVAASRLLMALALSIALVGVGGLVLQVTGIGLRPQSWVLLLSGITLMASLTALSRRVPSTTEKRLSLNLNFVQLVMITASVAMVFFAFRLAQDGAQQQPRPGFTQLWMLPSDTSLSEIELGIRNEEQQAVTYRLVVTVGGQNAGEWESIPLTAGELWGTSALVPLMPGVNDTVEAMLYRSDAPDQVYRSVTLHRTQAS